MKYKILVLDLDGTLTNSRKEITDRTKHALETYQKEGGIVVLASGRPTYGIMPLADELNLKTYGGYILAFNGGQIIDCQKKSVIWQKVMPVEMNRRLYELAKENQVVIMTYENENLITEDPEHRYVKKEMMINHMGVKKVTSFSEYVSFPVTKCLMVEDGDYLAEVEKRVKDALGNSLSIYRSEPFFLEIMPEGIDKAASLDWLLRHLHMSRENMAAFGDGFNDKTMIEFAGFGVAMGNAQETVKDAADWIAPSNDEDGVAWVVENIPGFL